MNLKDYISNDIQDLSPKSSVKTAQKLFKAFPINNNTLQKKQLIGRISETDISSIEDKNTLLSEYGYLMDHFSIDEHVTLWS